MTSEGFLEPLYLIVKEFLFSWMRIWNIVLKGVRLELWKLLSIKMMVSADVGPRPGSKFLNPLFA